MVSALIPSPDGAVENDRHHHHDHHTVEMDAEVTPGPTPDTDPVGVIEAALVRLVDDVGVLAEEPVVRAFAVLKATDMVMAVPEEVRAKIVADIPTGRLGTPEEIAYGVAFLAAEEAGWITGSNLDINGGHHMGW